MTIKHLVISGGGPTMIHVLAAVQKAESLGHVHLDNIESVYGTSAGAVIGTMLCLKFDWGAINDYILDRPWQDVFPIKLQTFIDAFYSKGLFGRDTIKQCFASLFAAKNIELDISLDEFYKYCGVEQHFFAFDVSTFQLVDLSYKTHPKMSLMTALHATCAIPILFSPVCDGDRCYIDGGITCNYPMRQCRAQKTNDDEIMGFKNTYGVGPGNELDLPFYIQSIGKTTNILEYGLNFIINLVTRLDPTSNNARAEAAGGIVREILFTPPKVSIEFYKRALSSSTVRRQLFASGGESARGCCEGFSTGPLKQQPLPSDIHELYII